MYHDNIQEYVSQAAAANFNQANSGYRPPMVSNQIRPPGFPPVQNPHANNQNNFNRGNNFNQNRGNNPNNGSTEDVQPPVVQIQSRNPNPEPNVSPVVSPIPFPSRRNDERRKEKADEQIEKFYEIFKDMNFEISFLDALTLMPKFASTLKALIGNKEKLSEMAKLNETCSAHTKSFQPPVVQIQTRNPNPEPNVAPVVTPVPKASIPFPSRRNDERRKEKANDQIEKFYEIFRDLSFEISFTDALMLMPNLSLPELTPTCMTLELADRSITEPIGIAEDVFVNVGKFQFPADFVVVDFEPDPRVPLILGRCFLKTSHALIDVYEGEITLRVGKEAITFNLDQTSKYTADYNHMTVNKIGLRKELKLYEAKSSVDEPPEVELKELSPHLEYAFLEGDDKLPVIIAKDLKDEEKAALLKVLKSHKRAIAWKLSDIKGVSPEFCTHKILMEEDYEPSVQSQRRVNPKIHDVIKKEVEKLLDAGLIYPISDSPWVSPVHCVPKKGGGGMYCHHK
ncbi:reverse transcriptase domain-containing protein [Tanacetum coccineum]